MANITEVWRDVGGYIGIYQVSNLGNVRSLDRIWPRFPNRIYKGKPLKGCLHLGYKHVTLGDFVRLKTVDALPKSMFKNGLVYTMTYCESRMNNGKGPFWYVGVKGNGINNSAAYYRPSIFRSIDLGVQMMFEKLTEEQPIYAN